MKSLSLIFNKRRRRFSTPHLSFDRIKSLFTKQQIVTKQAQAVILRVDSVESKIMRECGIVRDNANNQDKESVVTLLTSLNNIDKLLGEKESTYKDFKQLFNEQFANDNDIKYPTLSKKYKIASQFDVLLKINQCETIRALIIDKQLSQNEMEKQLKAEKEVEKQFAMIPEQHEQSQWEKDANARMKLLRVDNDYSKDIPAKLYVELRQYLIPNEKGSKKKSTIKKTLQTRVNVVTREVKKIQTEILNEQ